MQFPWFRRISFLSAAASLFAVAPLTAQRVVLDNIQTLKLGAASGINAGKVTGSGELVAISIQDRRLFWMQEGKPAKSSPIQGMPEEHSALRLPDLMSDLAIDTTGKVYIPAVWHEAAGAQGKKFVSGLFVFGPTGGFSHTVRLEPPVAARRVALDGIGNLYVAGIDGDYFRGLAPACQMVHNTRQPAADCRLFHLAQRADTERPSRTGCRTSRRSARKRINHTCGGMRAGSTTRCHSRWSCVCMTREAVRSRKSGWRRLPTKTWR